ncbi:MAG: hypothetical protein ABFS56_17630 [Pseudomonadota bacterium]
MLAPSKYNKGGHNEPDFRGLKNDLTSEVFFAWISSPLVNAAFGINVGCQKPIVGW